MVRALQFLAIAITAYFFIKFLPLFRPYPYADDWIYTSPIKFKSLNDWISWLFAQHVDHRIPIQKLSNYAVLRLSSFDFRYLIAFNYLLALLMTFNLLYIARTYRGYQSIFDALIPLVCLEYAAGFTQWGFQFQFLFSMVATTGFAYFCFRYLKSDNIIYMVLACFAILASALSGINGLIAATWCTIALLGWIALNFAKSRTKEWFGVIALLCVCLAIEATIWLTWTPTDATGVEINVSELFRFMTGLLPSSMLVYAFDNLWWKAAIMAALLITAVIVFLRTSLRKLDFGQFILMTGVGASLLIIISVSIGRAKAQGGWSPAIGMHYGYLLILIPVMSWIIVSKNLSRGWANLVGIVLLAIFTKAFFVNLDWRNIWVSKAYQHQIEVMKAVQRAENPQDVVDQYALDFTWSVEPHFKTEVVEGINTLREIDAEPYMYVPTSPEQTK